MADEWERALDAIRSGPAGPAKDLLLASWRGDAALVQRLLREDSSLVNHAEESAGLTALHLAAASDKPAVLKALLHCGHQDDVHLDRFGRTPLDLVLWQAWQGVREGSCFYLLAKGVERRAWRVKEEERQRQRPPPGLDDVQRVLQYLFPMATSATAPLGADFLCHFRYGGRIPATLLLDDGSVFFSCDRPEESFSLRDGLASDSRVLAVHCQSVGRPGGRSDTEPDQRAAYAEPALLCVVLMKAASEWLQQPGLREEDLKRDELQTFLEEALSGSRRAESITTARHLVQAVVDELARTRDKMNTLVASIKSLRNEEKTFTNHRAAVVFLRFLETFALQDFFQEGFTERQRRFLVGRKKAFFDTLLPKEALAMIRKIREILFDRANMTKKCAAKLPDLFSCEQAFRCFKPVSVDAPLFFKRLLEFAIEATEKMDELCQANAVSWNTNLFEVLVDPTLPGIAGAAEPDLKFASIQSPDETLLENKFLEDSRLYVQSFHDADTRHSLRYELEFNLIVNIRSLPSLNAGEILHRRNKATHSRGHYTLMTEDVASCLFDYYRRKIVVAVLQALQQDYASKNKSQHINEQKLKKVLQQQNGKFSSIADWYRFSDAKWLAIPDQVLDQNADHSLDVAMPHTIDLYLRTMARFLVSDSELIRDAYADMPGKDKAQILKLSNENQIVEALHAKLGFQIGDFIEVTCDSGRNWGDTLREVQNTMSALRNVQDWTKAFNTSWQDLSDLYNEFVQKKGNCDFLKGCLLFRKLDTARSEGVEKLMESLPKPDTKVWMPLPLRDGSGYAALSDVVQDLLSLTTGRHSPAKLLIEDHKELFADTTIVHLMVQRYLKSADKKTSKGKGHGSNGNFFLVAPSAAQQDPNDGLDASVGLTRPGEAMLEAACKQDFTAPLAAHLVPLMTKGQSLPATFSALVDNVLSTPGLLHFVSAWSASEQADEILAVLLDRLGTGDASPQAVTAVLQAAVESAVQASAEVARKSPLQPNAIPARVCHQAARLVYDLVEQRKIKAAEILESAMQWPPSEARGRDFCRGWLRASKAHVTWLFEGGARRSTDDEELIGLLPLVKGAENDSPVEGMIALSLEACILSSLSNAADQSQRIQHIYSTILQELWKLINNQSQGPVPLMPAFSVFAAACLSSERYTTLLETNHFCRRFLNVFNLKMSQAFDLNRLARSFPFSYATVEGKIRAFVECAEHYHELLQVECQNRWTTRKFGVLRTLMRLGHVHKQLAKLCGRTAEGWYHRTKAFEMFLLLRARQIAISGALSPHIRETVRQIQQLFDLNKKRLQSH